MRIPLRCSENSIGETDDGDQRGDDTADQCWTTAEPIEMPTPLKCSVRHCVVRPCVAHHSHSYFPLARHSLALLRGNVEVARPATNPAAPVGALERGACGLCGPGGLRQRRWLGGIGGDSAERFVDFLLPRHPDLGEGHRMP